MGRETYHKGYPLRYFNRVKNPLSRSCMCCGEKPYEFRASYGDELCSINPSICYSCLVDLGACPNIDEHITYTLPPVAHNSGNPHNLKTPGSDPVTPGAGA